MNSEAPKKKRKVFVPSEPPRTLTAKDCRELLEEAERYRRAMVERLDLLDNITPNDLQIRAK